MGFERNFALGFAWRLLLLLVTTAALVFTVSAPDLRAARIVAGAATIGVAWSLWYYIGRTNREVARFVEGLRYGDFSQGFSRTGGGGFNELGQALGDAMRQLRAERAQANEEARVHAALADESPAALLLVDQDDRVTLSNKAARRLFKQLDSNRINGFSRYGPDLVAVLRNGEVGTRKIVPLRIDDVVQRAMVSRASLERLGHSVAIVAVQPIQQELSTVELAAQADLVRVLTHEIMNSMTPVVSLAESAARLMADIQGECRDLADARAAVETLARRAAGIMHFVEAYRTFSQAPAVVSRSFSARAWAEELQRLFAASEAGRGVSFSFGIEPEDLQLNADPDLLAQVAINLLKNGAEAAQANRDFATITLSIRLLPGGRSMIAIQDNGPGIPPDLAAEIFLPFFTTKTGGTGVGLSLARRIVTAHGGTIALGQSNRGARFEIVL